MVSFPLTTIILPFSHRCNPNRQKLRKLTLEERVFVKSVFDMKCCIHKNTLLRTAYSAILPAMGSNLVIKFYSKSLFPVLHKFPRFPLNFFPIFTVKNIQMGTLSSSLDTPPFVGTLRSEGQPPFRQLRGMNFLKRVSFRCEINFLVNNFHRLSVFLLVSLCEKVYSGGVCFC